MALCILVSGPPCAGKSTLARALVARFGWSLLAKDAYKEALFERLGVGDRRWSARVSLLAWERLLGDAGALLVRGGACLLEGNFRAQQAEVLAALAAMDGARFLEVRCTARPEVLRARYLARALDGSRHAGHVDLEALPGIEPELVAAPEALLGRGSVLELDTTTGIDVDGAIRRLEPMLDTRGAPPRAGRGARR